MSAISVFDAVSLGSGLALFALFSTRHSGATLWRRRLVAALLVSALLIFGGLAAFYRPASWGPLLSDLFAGDWRDWAKLAAASLAGALLGRRLRRALDARGAPTPQPAARPAAPPPPAPAAMASPRPRPAPVPPAPQPRASLWNKLPPLRRAPQAKPASTAQPPAPVPAPVADAAPAPTVGPPPPSLWARLRRAPPPTRSTTPPGVSPSGRPWGAPHAMLFAVAALASTSGEARAQARPAPAAPAGPARPDPDVMRRAMLRTLIQSNQIVFEKEGGSFVPRCRCGPKLAPGETPKMLIDVLVATEDKRFWDHYGVDPIGIARGMLRALVRRRAEGGSTITQQLVKNAILTSERSLNRKRQEAQLALAVEAAMSKTEIVSA